MQTLADGGTMERVILTVLIPEVAGRARFVRLFVEE